MSLKEVKAKIRAIKKIHQVTKAMEAVSAVKMRRSQATAIEARPFALHAIGMLHRLIEHGSAHEHPLVLQRPQVRNVLMVAITSDRGLASALNTNVLKRVHAHMHEKGWTRDTVGILAIGKKGYEHFASLGYNIVDHVERWGEGVALGDPNALAAEIIKEYAVEHYDRVMLVYNNFESTFVQEPVVRRLLPISFAALEEVIQGIVPARGKYSELTQVALSHAPHEYMYEPDAQTILDQLLPYMINVMLYHAVLEANASEHSARMVAMKSASDRARDLSTELNRTFNKARQTAITAEVSEITSGIEAMR